MDKTIEERVDELLFKEADLIEELIDKRAEHSTEIDNFGKLLNHHEKAIESDRAFTDRSEQSANTERELRDRLETNQNDRDIKRREMDLKEKEYEATREEAADDHKTKWVEALLHAGEITVKIVVPITCTLMQLNKFTGFVDQGYRCEAEGRYMPSDTFRWVTNGLRNIK